MGFRTRISGLPAIRFGSLLVLNIVVQILCFGFIAATAIGGCGTLMPGETPPPPDPFYRTDEFLILLFSMEVVTAVLFVITNWATLAVLAFVPAWALPSLMLPVSGIVLLMFWVPVVMLFQARKWEFEDGPVGRRNPIPSSAR